MDKIKLTLLLIVILSLFLRVYRIDSIPPSLTWDEAALGYNAYSLLQTGRDEYGNLLPLNLKSFGDYKPALYAYITIPFVAAFGLNEFAVRLPSALFGVGTVILVFYLARLLFKNQTMGLISAALLAISPISIQFSRAAFESNVALFLNVLGLLLFLKGLTNKRMLIFAFIPFSLSLFTYQSSRLIVPLLIFGLLMIYKNTINFNIYLKTGLGMFLISIAITIYLLLGAGQSNRLAVANVFAYPRSIEYLNQITKEDSLPHGSFIFQVIHGEWFSYIRGLSERYLNYFSPDTLFIKGDNNPRHGVPDQGLVFYSSILLLPLGFISLIQMIKNRNNSLGVCVVFYYLLISPLPAALSRDLINILRAQNMIIPLVIIEALGFMWILKKIPGLTKKWMRLAIIIVAPLVIICFAIYLDRYFIHLPKENSQGWLYGYKQVIQEIDKLNHLDSTIDIIVTDHYGQPYVYYLFYTKYPPERFQGQVILDQSTLDVGTVRKIDNIQFQKIDWHKDRNLNNVILVGTHDDIPEAEILRRDGFKSIKEILFLNGKPAFELIGKGDIN